MEDAKDIKRLLAEAFNAQRYAYAPYSRFAVGAALLTESGNIFSGCNVENSSYSATICAERVAIGCAVSAGERKFRLLAIAANSRTYVRPCGVCRQVISEFGPETRVICANVAGEFEIHECRALLPFPFVL